MKKSVNILIFMISSLVFRSVSSAESVLLHGTANDNSNNTILNVAFSAS